MELFNFFIQYLRKKDPDLADIVLPHMEDYIWDRRNVTTNDALLEGFNPDASLPFPDKEIQEQWQDEKDNDAFKAELKNAGNDFDEALERWQGNGQPTAPAVSQAAWAFCDIFVILFEHNTMIINYLVIFYFFSGSCDIFPKKSGGT